MCYTRPITFLRSCWSGKLIGSQYKILFSDAASSQKWLARQRSDPYVRQARIESYRCRSAFKLLELHSQIPGGLLHPGDIVVDCGAAPGSWSQVAASLVLSSPAVQIRKPGLVIAFDLLDFLPIPGVVIHPRTDLRDVDLCAGLIEEAVTSHCASPDALDHKVNVVLSDMAPNVSGMRSLDVPGIMELAACVLQLAVRVSAPGASLVVKLWQSPELKAFQQVVARFYVGETKQSSPVRIMKPPASRNDSSEVYLVARGFQLPQS